MRNLDRPGRLGLLLALSLVALSAPAVEAQPAPLRGLDAYVERGLREWQVPGLAIAVVRNDSVVFARGYGVREEGRPERVDAHTLFAIGSNTKAFTAATVGLLVDEGKLRWDDPVIQHLPGFQLFDPYVTRELTLRDLLTHRSGLARGDMMWYASEYDRDEILRRVRYLEPSWSFRSRYGYQNIMFLAAGEVVARAAGKSWDEVVKERIFRPLGMHTSNTSVLGLQRQENVASPHYQLNGQSRPIPWRNIDNVAPAGSINSNVVEMAQWLRLLLGNGRFAGQQVLSEEVVQEMFTPQMLSGPARDTLFPSTHFTAYGLGLGLRNYQGRKIVMHGGGIDGMLSLTAVVPEEGLGVVILTNAEGQNLQNALLWRILDAYLGAPQRDWSAIFLAQHREAVQRGEAAERKRAEERVQGTTPSLPLERYAGTYEHPFYGRAQVALENGSLVLRRGPAFTGTLEHWHFNTFRSTWEHPRLGRSFVTFNLDARAQVAEMQLEDLGEFKRVPER